MSQTISAIATISSKTPGAAPFTVNAPTSTSGLPVTLTVKSGPATISGTPGGTYTVTLNGTAGTVVIAANQAGNSDYTAATEVTTSFGVAFLSQTVNSIPTISGRTSNSPPFTVISPTSSSGLPVTLSVKSGPATITGIAGGVYTITLTGEPGAVIIAANQSGNSNYFPASEVIAIFSVMFVKNISTKINLQKNDQIFATNTSWTEDYANFTGYGFTGYTGSAGMLLNNFAKQNDLYIANYGVQTTGVASGATGIYRSYISLKNLKKNNVFSYDKVDSSDAAWASYNLYSGSGMARDSQNVSSYAIEFVNKIGFNYSLLTTGTKTGYRTVTIDTPPPYLTLTTGNLLNQIVCLSTVDCEFPQPVNAISPKPNPFARFLDSTACWTGKSTTGQEYRTFLANFLKVQNSGSAWGGLLKSPPKFTSSTINQILITATGAPGTSGFFDYISGNLICQPFVTGDSVSFSLYNFDYTGLYRSYHNSYPIYPTTGFTLNYPQDFTGYQDLTDQLNTRLNNSSYPVWYPYSALSGSSVGVYITGSLMNFELNNTGSSIPYISFFSNRNYTSGFNISLNTGQRGKIQVLDVSSYESSVNQVSGYSYLLPNQIDLQGYDENSSSWIVLDRQTDIFNQLTGLEPTPFVYSGYSGWFDSGVQVFIPPAITGDITGSSAIVDNTSVFPTVGGFETLFSGTQTAYAQKNEYCPPVSDTRSIAVVQPTGWPSGLLSGCVYTGVNRETVGSYCGQWMAENGVSGIILFTDDQRETTPACSSPGLGLVPYVILNQGTCWVCTGVGSPEDSGIKPFESTAYFLRTGWNLNPTGRYLNCLLSNKQYDITQLNFSKYRIAMTGFSGTTIYNDQDSYYLQQNSFIFKSINLYSAVNTFSSITLMSGTRTQSPIGLPYTLQVQGVSKLPFSVDYNYSMSGQADSGIHLATNEAIYHLPTGNEINTAFNKSSGKFVGQVTGFVSGIFAGSGIVSSTFGNYYFYNPANNEVTFSKTLTGYSSGSAVLSGREIVLTQSAINRSIIVGGSLSNQSYYTDFYTGNIIVTGNIVDAPYQKDNVSGFYILTGSITGTTNSGYLNYGFPVTGQYDGNLNNVPYYYIPTGFIGASAMVRLNFTALKNYNYLAINSNAITYYDPVNGDYFNSISGLLSIINSSPLTYQVSGADLTGTSFSGQYSGMTGVMLYSLLSGSSGNFITLDSDTTSGIIVPSGGQLTGGRDLYSVMFNTNTFSGTAGGVLYQTGFYNSVLPTGTVYGPVSTYQFTRRFENVWALSTGLPRNLLVQYTTGNNLVAPGQYLGVMTGDSDLGQYDNLVKLNLNYYNQYNMPTGVGSDVIDLYVTGYNFPSGTGIMFRITGAKE